MTSKTLSTGTLSLRFMQNANRAKHLKEVELDRAEVHDDGKWEIGQAAKDVWGSSSNAEPSVSAIHEASYIPFLFGGSSQESNATDKLKGRRVFGRQGVEITQESLSSESKPTTTTPQTPPAPETSTKGRKIHPRPISISASGSSGRLRGFEQLKEQKNGKTAKQAIFETGGVGVDLRGPSSTKPQPTPAKATVTPDTFLKPSGVDDPKELDSSVGSSKTTVIDGARMKRSKRDREAAADPSTEGKTPKKKKKKTVEG